MELIGLPPRQYDQSCGVEGLARVVRCPGEVLRQLRAGDIAIVNQVDLDRRTAEALVNAEVVGVVNAAQSITGRFPTLGPELLLSAGIALIDGVGSEMLSSVKDGTRLRLHSGGVFVGDDRIGVGEEQSPDSIADRVIMGKAGMVAQLEAFSANAGEFLRAERHLVLDGIGVPQLGISMEDRHVLVLAPGPGHAQELKELKHYLRQYQPILIGVGSAADTLVHAGYVPDVVMGDPAHIATVTLMSGAYVVVAGGGVGRASAVESVQDLGLHAVAFPASGNTEDLALLLAEAHGASLIVTAGTPATLHEFLDRGRSRANPSTFVTRLKLGDKLVDGAAVAKLERRRVHLTPILILSMISLLLGVCLVAVLSSGDHAVWLMDFGTRVHLMWSQVSPL